MIDKQTIDNVIETSNERIVDIVSDYVSLHRRGANYVGCCPFHNEKTGSFTVSPAKGLFKCFGCGKAGNALTFIMEYEHMTFSEGIKYLGGKVGIVVKEETLSPEQEQAKSDRESMMAVNEYAKNKFVSNLWETQEGITVGLPYFRGERGFRDDIIKKFELGYSLSKRDTFTQDALAHGYKLEFLTKTGLSIQGDNGYKADRFYGRLMFPFHSPSGRVIGFGGRVKVKTDNVAKYQNSIDSEIFHKRHTLYGIFQAKAEISRKKLCYLVEGYTDVISMHQAGITNVVASSGTSLTNEQVEQLKRYTPNVTVLYDGDSAGIHASERGIDMLLAAGLNVKVLLLPNGEDPDSFARAHTAEEYISYIESHQTDFIHFKVSHLMEETKGDPTKKAELIKNIISTISVVQDTILRTVYIQECSRMMGVDETTLFSALEQMLVGKAVKERDDHEKARVQRQNQEAHQRALNQNPPTPEEEQAFYEQQIHPVETGVSTPVVKRVNPYEYEERELMRFFVTYVNKILFRGTESQTTVGEYVVSQLAADDIQSVDPVVSKTLQVYIESPERDKVTPEHFINQPDPEVTSFAANLISLSSGRFIPKDGEEADVMESKYRLSKYHQKYYTIVGEAEQLDDLVPRIMNEVRFKRLTIMIEDIKEQMKDADDIEDEGAVEDLMARLLVCNEAKRRLSKLLGNRTFL